MKHGHVLYDARTANRETESWAPEKVNPSQFHMSTSVSWSDTCQNANLDNLLAPSTDSRTSCASDTVIRRVRNRATFFVLHCRV